MYGVLLIFGLDRSPFSPSWQLSSMQKDRQIFVPSKRGRFRIDKDGRMLFGSADPVFRPVSSQQIKEAKDAYLILDDSFELAIGHCSRGPGAEVRYCAELQTHCCRGNLSFREAANRALQY
jgi:hypothetical protein